MNAPKVPTRQIVEAFNKPGLREVTFRYAPTVAPPHMEAPTVSPAPAPKRMARGSSPPATMPVVTSDMGEMVAFQTGDEVSIELFNKAMLPFHEKHGDALLPEKTTKGQLGEAVRILRSRYKTVAATRGRAHGQIWKVVSIDPTAKPGDPAGKMEVMIMLDPEDDRITFEGSPALAAEIQKEFARLFGTARSTILLTFVEAQLKRIDAVNTTLGWFVLPEHAADLHMLHDALAPIWGKWSPCVPVPSGDAWRVAIRDGLADEILQFGERIAKQPDATQRTVENRLAECDALKMRIDRFAGTIGNGHALNLRKAIATVRHTLERAHAAS